MTEMFGEAWPPMSVPDLAPDDDDDNDSPYARFLPACSPGLMIFGLRVSELSEAWDPTSN